MNPKIKTRRGQAVFLSIFLIGALILGATTIAGFLMVVQLRQVSDVADSAKAIFAADAGVNCALYNFSHPSALQCYSPDGVNSQTTIPLANKASATFTCFKDRELQNVVECKDPTTLYVLSKGSAGTSRRAFLYTIVEAPPAGP